MNPSIVVATVTALGARLTSFALNIIGLPIALASLGQKEFGLFLMLGGFAAVASVANLGLARIVALHTARRLSSSSIFVGELFRTTVVTAAVLGFIVFLVLATLALSLPWLRLIPDFDPGLQRDFLTAAVLLALIMGLWVALAPFEGLAAGLHKLMRLNLFRTGGFIVNLLGILFVVTKAPSLTTCVLFFSSGIVVGDFLHMLFLLWSRRDLAFGRVRLRRRVLRSIYRDSISGLMYSVGFAGLYQFSTALVGFSAGPEEAVLFGIIMRMLMNSLSAVQGYFNAVWPAVAAGIRDAAGRHRAVRLIWQSVGVGAMIGLLGAGGIIVFGQFLLHAWMGRDLGFTPLVRIVSGVLCFTVVLELALKSSLYALGLMRFSAMITLAEAIIFLTIGSVVLPYYGGTGALILLCVAQLIIAIPFQTVTLIRGIQSSSPRRALS